MRSTSPGATIILPALWLATLLLRISGVLNGWQTSLIFLLDIPASWVIRGLVTIISDSVTKPCQRK